MKWFPIIERSRQSTAKCRHSLASIFIIVCSLAGCSHDDGKHGTVSGMVTLDGQPLPAGSIHFTPADGHTSPAEGAIADGNYSVVTGVGESRVSISSSKVVGKRKMYNTPDSPTVDNVIELLPAQYNTQSTLTLKVVPGSQQQPYDLKSSK
jgi:hypothetical protein